jgi:hypothetical protein
MDAAVLGNHGIPSDLHFAEVETVAAIYYIIVGLVLKARDIFHSFVNGS